MQILCTGQWSRFCWSNVSTANSIQSSEYFKGIHPELSISMSITREGCKNKKQLNLSQHPNLNLLSFGRGKLFPGERHKDKKEIQKIIVYFIHNLTKHVSINFAQNINRLPNTQKVNITKILLILCHHQLHPHQVLRYLSGVSGTNLSSSSCQALQQS